VLHDDNRYAGGVLYVLFKLCFVSDRGEVVQGVELTLVLLSRRACGEAIEGPRMEHTRHGKPLRGQFQAADPGVSAGFDYGALTSVPSSGAHAPRTAPDYRDCRAQRSS
jgi:hypothetical protein